MRTLASAVIALLVSACGSNNGGTRVVTATPGGTLDEGAVTADDGESTADEARLTVEMAAPYFTQGKAAEGARQLRLENWAAARAAFAAHLETAGDELAPADRARLTLLIATADAELDDWDAAAEGFETALEALPLLSDYLHHHAARARYFAHDMDEALAHARAVAADSIVGADAELLAGDILRGRKDWKAMAGLYESYLEDRPDGIRLPEARFRLAQAYEHLDRAVPDALTLYRRVTISAPLSPWAERASERMDELLDRVPESDRAEHTELSADEYVERGMVYFRAMRNPKSEADFAAALEAPGLTDETRCIAAYHRAKSVQKARERKRAAPLFDEAIELCQAAGHADLYVKSAYNAGRCYAFITGWEPKAIERYALIEEHHPEHTYADDARLRQAEEYDDMDDQDKVTELLASIPKIYPQGDMRGEAMWRLAWRAIKADEWAEALEWLDRQIATKPIADKYWAEGQAQYWKGRAHAELGNDDASVAAYEEAVRRYPVTYYALLSLNRLRESHPERFAALVEEIQAPPESYDPDAPPFEFEAREVYATERFRRGLEFMKLGLGWAAEAEFRRLGLTPPPGKDPVTDPDQIEKLWAMAYLYHLAGRYDTSHWVTRWHVLDYKRRWPVGHNRLRWEIAYPPGYYQLLHRWAQKRGFPTTILQAIVREESAFDPIRESWANAIGLTQMIFPTARRFAKGTGIEVTRDNLRDPDKNVAIGSNFLDFLWEKWDGMIALIPPSYNAGEGAVMRWVRTRGDWPTDEWSEEIPYDQARRYSKRVISTYFAYAWLRDRTIPEMPNTIPEKLR